MINSTQTIRISSINTSFDPQGVKIVSGYCIFQHYSKDGVVEECLTYRAKGAPAMSISSEQTTGVAIGYLDIKVVDNGTYKTKTVSLVIRSFIPTATVVESETPAPTQASTPTPVPVVSEPVEPAAVVPVVPAKKTNKPKKEKQLVGALAATSNGKGRLNVVDIDADDIPF